MAPTNDRLARAKAYLTIAESQDAARAAYTRAADEIVAARKEDSKLTWAEIDRRIGRSSYYARKVVQWRTSATWRTQPTPFAHGGQSEHRVVSDKAAAKRILREQPMEVVEQIIEELPQERKADIAAAAHDEYFEESRRQALEQKNRTPKERREITEAVNRMGKPIRDMASALTAELIVMSLEEATEDLNKVMAEEGGLTPDQARKIDEALEAFQSALAFAKQMAGGE